jgi:hypothetical protein
VITPNIAQLRRTGIGVAPATLRKVNWRENRRCDLGPADGTSRAFDRIACCKATKAHKKLLNVPFDGSDDLCKVTLDDVAMTARAISRSTHVPRRPPRRRQMTGDGATYLLPEKLEPDLERVLGYWNGLKRGGNEIPFWDDVKISMKTRLGRDVFLMEAFENPPRYRFDLIGDDVIRQYGTPLNGKFTHEIELRPPIDDLTTQCWFTIDRREPTYLQHGAGSGTGYSRLVLPLWGNGRIEMLLGAITPHRGGA